MASSAAAAASEDRRQWGYAKPTDGGVYILKEGTWYCCICKAFAPESHLGSKNHLWYLQEHLTGQLLPMESLEDVVRPGIAPPPPPGQPTDDRPGPPPPRGEAHMAVAVSNESVFLINARLAIISNKLDTKIDIIVAKLGAMEARLQQLERKIDALWWSCG